MIASLATEPKSQFVQRRGDYVNLLVQITTQLKEQLTTQLTKQNRRQVLSCAAELMSYFQHRNEWKRSRYQEDWFYHPLRKIQEDLNGAYSLHVVRGSIALLRELKFLSVKINDRTSNNRNGQDKTHYYLLHYDRVKTALAKLYPQSKQSKTRKNPQLASDETCSVEAETCSVEAETPRFNVETYTEILSIDTSTNSYSLLEEREEAEFFQEDEDPWTVEEDELDRELLELFNSAVEIPEKQQVSAEDHFSVPAEPKSTKMVETSASPLHEPKCSEVAQDDLKSLPKLKSDRSSGFRSNAERKGFYKALLELGKTQGKRFPAAWSTKIVKSIDAGELCHYLSEYREGQQVGSCEKQEWEIAPGQPYERFISYLTTRLKKAEMTDEQAIAAAHQQLRDVNLARSLWESCKRCIANRREDWEKQKKLGVQNAYLPPELLPQREVSLEQVGNAIASLQSGCVQLQAVEPAELTSAAAELEPTEEKFSDPEPEFVTLQALQQKLNSPVQASLARILARKWGYRIEEGLVLPAEGMPSVDSLRSLLTNPLTAPKVERLIDAHPDWGFWIDAAGEIHDF